MPKKYLENKNSIIFLRMIKNNINVLSSHLHLIIYVKIPFWTCGAKIINLDFNQKLYFVCKVLWSGGVFPSRSNCFHFFDKYNFNNVFV
jgi:hypothetical protein